MCTFTCVTLSFRCDVTPRDLFSGAKGGAKDDREKPSWATRKLGNPREMFKAMCGQCSGLLEIALCVFLKGTLTALYLKKGFK